MANVAPGNPAAKADAGDPATDAPARGPQPTPAHVASVEENVDHRGRPLDPERVDVNDEWELRHWATELGLSEDQLRAAVQEVGNLTTRLRRYVPPQ